ncbi:uncharacterized protein LOC131165692 [Malania oleifera]|uniref:uncharacterized protein LOC131165692 n=1 Tax=Malania oleifera TaxID=397392 RepID=UPI0025AE00AD|nr:uncharacterized protein LOC131165692 [Malania oleifera]XP_057979689.1 uncharacterized protein LOC131165692 [Malania oleifera]XP_057979696.1 uncharacterized protein LOC131165692 [Malania oleifera]
MAFLVIPDKVKTLWDEWNLRVAVLTSLFFQVLLIFSASSRKRTGNVIITSIIWSAYLLADWVAAFAVGLISNSHNDLISNSQKDCIKATHNEDLLAFWAPFLLLHLGGPDAITAFSLEDNELWIRHLLGLVIQLAAVVYVFSQTLPNSLWLPTTLMFFAGTTKYAERTRALYLACMGNFKASMLPAPDAGPNYAQLMEEYSSNKEAQVPVDIIIVNEPDKEHKTPTQDEELPSNTVSLNDIEIVQHGYMFFDTFKGLIVDLMFSFHERNESRKFFFQRNAKDAFKVMEVELNFMYDVLYTKMAVVHRKIGYFFRLICTSFIVVSFERFAVHHKHEGHKFDIIVTYTLLIGAMSLELIGFLKLIFSDWTIVLLKNGSVKKVVAAIREKISLDNRCRWSKSVSLHSLISYCLKTRFNWLDKVIDFIGLKDFMDELKYKKTKPVEKNLEEFIFNELKEKALKAKDLKTAKEICSARGDWVLSQNTCHYQSILSTVEVEYDESLLLWHIATELCYYTEYKADDTDENLQFSKLLSDYMLYLLVMRPTMMSAVAGIGQIRFQDTCEEAKKFFRRGQFKRKWSIVSLVASNQKISTGSIFQDLKKIFYKGRSESMAKQMEVCQKLLSVNTDVKPMDVKGDRSKSVLFDACILAKDLKKLKKERRWKLMSKVWVELLSYAACHCRANAHAQQLSKGGELITFVWLLMAHFGMGEQFRIEAGHARAKLIVSK